MNINSFTKKHKDIVVGLGLFLYFFLLLLSTFIPSLQLGFVNGFSPAFLYRSIISIIAFGIIGPLFYKKHHSINYVLGIGLIVFLITNILAIFLSHNGTSVSTDIKLFAFLYLLSIIFTIFAFFEVFPSYLTKKSIVIFFILVDTLMLVCTLYSLIFEFNDIINAFTATGEDAHFYQIHSFFDNKNSYGFMLFVAIIGTLVIYKCFQKKWLVIPIIYFGINLVVSRAKTALIVVVFLVLIYGVNKFITTFKNNKIRNILIGIGVVLLVVMFMLLIPCPINASLT